MSVGNQQSNVGVGLQFVLFVLVPSTEATKMIGQNQRSGASREQGWALLPAGAGPRRGWMGSGAPCTAHRFSDLRLPTKRSLKSTGNDLVC